MKGFYFVNCGRTVGTEHRQFGMEEYDGNDKGTGISGGEGAV